MSPLLFLVAALGLGLLIVLHEAGHFLVARLCGMRVERFAVFFGRPLLARKFGNTIYQIGWIPLGGYVQITGLNPHEEFDKNDPYVYPNRPRWMRVAVLAAGPIANYVTAVVLAIGLFMAYGMPTEQMKVEGTTEGSPAAAAGLRAGDVLVEANGQAITRSAPINKVIDQVAGSPLRLTVSRGGSLQRFDVTPRKDQASGRFLIGIRQGEVRAPVGVLSGVRDALVLPVVESGKMLQGIADMIRGKQKPSFAGPVGITNELKKAAEQGIESFLSFIMGLSIYLGLFNLLPVPALDGARIVFVGIGALLRRDVNARKEAAVHAVGLMVLMGTLLLVTYGDIKRLVGS
jgi:regulator of sigma E protease